MTRCQDRGVRGFKGLVELPDEPCSLPALPGERYCLHHIRCLECKQVTHTGDCLKCERDA